MDLSKPTLTEQQRQNFELAARFTRFIRSREPKQMPISVGGEIGEVGKENSTPEELRAYMDGYTRALGGGEGLAKISVQTGSSHGGVVGPDGVVQRVSIDFETLRRISVVAREEYGLAGAVQHGIARALCAADLAMRPVLKKHGMLTRDPRMKERKKPGLKRARKAPQYTKR